VVEQQAAELAALRHDREVQAVRMSALEKQFARTAQLQAQSVGSSSSAARIAAQ